jgi:hypothetical protein
MECASCRHSDAKNFQVASKFFENLCTPGLTYDKKNTKRLQEVQKESACESVLRHSEWLSEP